MKHSLLFQISALLIAATALPAQSTTCNNQTVKGTYAVTISGTRPTASVLPTLAGFPGVIETVVGIAIHTFDGNGGFTQTDNVKGSLSGIAENRPGGGVYSVNPDCTGSYSVSIPGNPFPIITRFVIIDSGAAFTAVVTSPQLFMIAATGRRVN